MTNPETLVLQFAKQARKAAEGAGYDRKSYKFASVIRGHWLVIVAERPYLSGFRDAFFEAAGAK